MVNVTKTEIQDISDDFLFKIRSYLPSDRVDDVSKAYMYAQKAHKGQMRLSGEPFFEHPKQTAIFLADLRLDANTLSAALLHDVIEDCDIPYSELVKDFGNDVATLVESVTKLTQAEMIAEHRDLSKISSSEEIKSLDDLARAETLRKMLMAMAEDIRVVLIKLADRLHNMRTISYLTESRRVAISRETLDIFAPLAHRLGIWEIKWLLEDLSFQQLDPDSYKKISKRLNSKRTERESYVEKIVNITRKELKSSGIDAEVYGRPKHIYSIHRKLERYRTQDKELGEIYDLFAIRVVLSKVQDCYAALGVIHSKWRPLPGQFDDYIANPKDNLYQSLHTAVVCEDSAPVEIQIRTSDMHQVAEYGVAAHWLYKEGGDQDEQFESKMTWVRKLLDWQRDADGAVEFVESFKTDIFQNQVYVYTPQEDVVELPVGATPLDFAYRIHTDVGHSCVGAKVNGKLVSLKYQLKNGDKITIMNSRTTSGPSLDWLNEPSGYVKTTSARSKIRQFFNKQERQSNLERGKEIFQRQLKRLDIGITSQESSELLKYNSEEDMFVALGDGTLTWAKLIARTNITDIDRIKTSSVGAIGYHSGVEVLGVGDLLTNIAKCCNPIMGDEILGFITRGRGVTIHRQNCSNIVNEDEPDRIVNVDWGETKTLYPVRIEVRGWDRVGLLFDVSSAVSDERININNISSENDQDESVISMTVYVTGTTQLNFLYTRLESITGIISVSRLRNLEMNESKLYEKK